MVMNIKNYMTAAAGLLLVNLVASCGSFVYNRAVYFVCRKGYLIKINFKNQTKASIERIPSIAKLRKP